jgi:tRNA-5-methyluridine54 2-sulfurtransferase
VDGNTGHELKEALNVLERGAPGAKAQFLFGFLDRHEQFASPTTEAPEVLGACTAAGCPPSPRPARSAGSASASSRPAARPGVPA